MMPLFAFFVKIENLTSIYSSFFCVFTYTLLPSPVVTQKCRLSAQFQGQLLHSAAGGEQQGDWQLLCRGRPYRRHLRRHHAQELETHLHLDSLLLC